MTSRNIFTLATLTVAITGAASPLTPQEALERLQQDLPLKVRSVKVASQIPVYTAKSQNGNPSAYVFNKADGGYLILGADDIAFPVLAYSDQGKISENDIPDAMKWWLSEYSRQIEFANSNNAVKAPGMAQSYQMPSEVIYPLLATKWDQDKPYNLQCPTSRDGVPTVTGCVATSMAQVMNFHKYPEIGEGIKQYTASKINRKLTINFAQKAFDWDNMLDYYTGSDYTEEEADAVAYLMKACGFSVEMNYGTDVSGAHGYNIADALIQYFKYDEGCHSAFRDPYSSSEWAQKIFDNLKNVGPIVINGQAPLSGGHSFVCDGYDGNGYYHFNWGWGGISDGYFALDALDPDAQGIGGAIGGFNFSQNGIFGIQPPTGETPEIREEFLFQWGTSIGSISGRTLTFDVKDYSPLGWGNLDFPELRVNVGAIIEKVDDPTFKGEVQGKMGNSESIYLSQGSYYSNTTSKPIIELPDLSDGIYRVTLASRSVQNPEQGWIPVKTTWGLINYVRLNVSGGSYTVTDITPSRFIISDVEVLSPAYCRKNLLLKVKITNDSDLELLQGLSPRLMNADGSIAFYGSSMLIAVDADSTVEKELVVKFYTENGGNPSVAAPTEYTMKFFDPQTNLYYSGIEVPVTLNPYPGATTLKLTASSINNSERGSCDLDGRHYYTIYFLKDTGTVTGSFSIKVNKGYFDGLVSVSVYKADKNDPYITIPVLTGVFSAYPFLAMGESATYDYSFHFPEADKETVYFVTINYTSGTTQSTLDTLPFALEEVLSTEMISEDNFPETFYNLQGVKIEEPQPGELVIVKKGTKVQKQIAR